MYFNKRKLKINIFIIKSSKFKNDKLCLKLWKLTKFVFKKIIESYGPYLVTAVSGQKHYLMSFKRIRLIKCNINVFFRKLNGNNENEFSFTK